MTPRPEMANLEYGGRQLSAASNIVFSNGLLDPWSSGSILKSAGGITAVIIPEGAHHLDLRASNPADPVSVIAARKMEKKHIRKSIQFLLLVFQGCIFFNSPSPLFGYWLAGEKFFD